MSGYGLAYIRLIAWFSQLTSSKFVQFPYPILSVRDASSLLGKK